MPKNYLYEPSVVFDPLKMALRWLISVFLKPARTWKFLDNLNEFNYCCWMDHLAESLHLSVPEPGFPLFLVEMMLCIVAVV